MYGAGPSKLSEFLHIDYNQACLVLQKFSSKTEHSETVEYLTHKTGQILTSYVCFFFTHNIGTFPKMQQFSKSVLDQCRNQGYLSTEAGRRRWFPHITSPNSQLRCYSERQAVNFLIQGILKFNTITQPTKKKSCKIYLPLFFQQEQLLIFVNVLWFILKSILQLQDLINLSLKYVYFFKSMMSSCGKFQILIF